MRQIMKTANSTRKEKTVKMRVQRTSKRKELSQLMQGLVRSLKAQKSQVHRKKSKSQKIMRTRNWMKTLLSKLKRLKNQEKKLSLIVLTKSVQRARNLMQKLANVFQSMSVKTYATTI